MFSSMSPAGGGVLDFEKVQGRTVVRTAFARSPLRLLTPKTRGQAAWVYTSSFGGGLVGGDALAIRIQVREGAEAVLLSQSSNKVYRSSLESKQSIDATIAADGILISIPDPTVCFEGSRFTQRQDFKLEDRASLLVVDTFNCGRSASGERWLFDRFRNRIQVRRSDRVLFLESLLLDSRAGSLAERIGRFNVFSVVLMFGPQFEAHGQTILTALAEQPIGRGADVLVTASALSTEGVVIRIAGVSTQEVGNTLRRFLHFIPERLGDNPWMRKG